MLKIIKLEADQLVRLHELSTSLQSVTFPFTALFNPNLLESLAGSSKNLDFFDKFAGKRIEYNLEHVQVPSYLYFAGDNWQALNADLCVAFGGTSSPVADSVWITTLLAQVVAKKGGTVISG